MKQVNPQEYRAQPPGEVAERVKEGEKESRKTNLSSNKDKQSFMKKKKYPMF